METKLTKEMKKGLIGFKPLMPTDMRTIRYGEEVWTPTGIVDFIRFEDYKKDKKDFCELINFDSIEKSRQEFILNTHKGDVGKCKCEGLSFPNKNCSGCFYKKSIFEIDMMVTCYECKITLPDFKSKNGHNFHGNQNYYVVPSYLSPLIENLVSEDIGIISYYPETKNYRIYKNCAYREISHELKEHLLYNTLKKWVDKCSTYYNYNEGEIQ